MRHIDIETCEWMSPRWLQLIQAGYRTELLSDDRIAVMTRGLAARDYVRNVMPRESKHWTPSEWQ